MSKTKLRIGQNIRHFSIQRPVGEGLLKEDDETLIPDALLNDILSNPPEVIPIKLGEALTKLKKLMEVEF
jgi:hypothetical protein